MRTKKKKKLFAPEPLMDFDRRVLSRLNRRTDETGTVSYVFENVPISQINLPKPWSEGRLADNLKKIKATKKVPPVLLSKDTRAKLYEISDGIHRTNVVKKLGYSHVPAVVSQYTSLLNSQQTISLVSKVQDVKVTKR